MIIFFISKRLNVKQKHPDVAWTPVQMLGLLTASDEHRCQNEREHVDLILLTLTRPVEL